MEANLVHDYLDLTQTCERVRNIMATTVSTTSSFENFYGEKPNIIGSFSEFGRIGYVTKQDNFKKRMTDKTFNVIIVGYAENNTRDTYKLYNPENKIFIVTEGVKWVDWKLPIPQKP